jgi:hypothetical protein
MLGTCFAPESKPLACRPQRGAGGPNQGPGKDKPMNYKSGPVKSSFISVSTTRGDSSMTSDFSGPEQ